MPVTLINTPQWNGLSPGDTVRVTGLRGTFRYHNHVTNDATGTTWVNVFGGVKNRERARSVLPTRVVKVRQVRRKEIEAS